MKVKDNESLNDNQFKLSIKLVNSILDFDCRDNILNHENNEELFEVLNR